MHIAKHKQKTLLPTHPPHPLPKPHTSHPGARAWGGQANKLHIADASVAVADFGLSDLELEKVLARHGDIAAMSNPSDGQSEAGSVEDFDFDVGVDLSADYQDLEPPPVPWKNPTLNLEESESTLQKFALPLNQKPKFDLRQMLALSRRLADHDKVAPSSGHMVILCRLCGLIVGSFL